MLEKPIGAHAAKDCRSDLNRREMTSGRLRPEKKTLTLTIHQPKLIRANKMRRLYSTVVGDVLNVVVAPRSEWLLAHAAFQTAAVK